MIKELREALDISISELSFVLDVDEEQIKIWEESQEIPELIVNKLKKRYSNYFGTNDNGMSYLKKKDIFFKNNKDNSTKLDKLLKKTVKKPPKKNKKIVLKKKKETSNKPNPKNDNNEKRKRTIITKKEVTSEKKNDDLNISTDYIKSLINDNNKEYSFSSLRDVRKYLKISQTELGDALDINQRKISIWEITNARLPKEIIEKISNIYDIHYDKISHLIEADESSYLMDNLPINKESPFYDNELDTLDIQTIRKTFGHSLRSFANEIGVHYQTVARWEKGNGIPKDYVLKVIIDKFLNRSKLKELMDKGIDVKLKEEYAHWKNDIEEEQSDDISQNLSKNDVKNIIDRKLELLSIMMDEGLEIDNIKINSKKNITITNSQFNFKASLILSEEAKENLKNLFC
jgi:DNA-binding transcriptional regulator YiaG